MDHSIRFPYKHDWKIIKVDDFQLHLKRSGLVLIIAILVAHFAGYQRLPWDADYRFPLLSVLLVSLFGIVICTFNFYIVKKLIKTKDPTKSFSLINEIGLVTLSTFIIYSILHLVVNIGLFNSAFNIFKFMNYLFIAEVVMVFEYLIMRSQVKPDSVINHPSAISKSILIKAGTKTFHVNPDDIALLYSKGGIVTLKQQNGSKTVTNFSSLEEVERHLPKTSFFRVNRQLLIHRDMVYAYRQMPNRTLMIELDENVCNGYSHDVRISRYKNTAFREWFERSDVSKN